jgi:hypothetical protein
MAATTSIILLASERSGTNLLRAIISSHSAIASPPPCGMVGLLAKNAHKYLSPLHPRHADELIADAILSTRTHLNQWDVEEPSVGDVKRRLQDGVSFWKVFETLNDIYAEASGYSFWLSKEPEMFKHIYEIAMHLPDARFIYMVRDGRDVAASMLKGGLHEHHVYTAALRWRENQRLCLTALSDPLLNDRMFFLKYEDLIGRPEQLGAELMEYIGLEFEAGQLEFYKNEEVLHHSQQSEFWKNLSRPIDASNKGKYRKSLSKREIRIFESVAWDEMHALSYRPDTPTRKPISLPEAVAFRLSAAVRGKIRQFSGKEEVRRQNARRAATRQIAGRNFWQ